MKITPESLRNKGWHQSADGQWHKPGARKMGQAAASLMVEQAHKVVLNVAAKNEAQKSASATGASGCTTDEQKLNKLERAFLAYLRTLYPNDWIGIQCFQLKLADDCRYCCDFWNYHHGELRGWEVKGFRREDAWIKLKVAARIYAKAGMSFTMVERIKGEWKFTNIKP